MTSEESRKKLVPSHRNLITRLENLQAALAAITDTEWLTSSGDLADNNETLGIAISFRRKVDKLVQGNMSRTKLSEDVVVTVNRGQYRLSSTKTPLDTDEKPVAELPVQNDEIERMARELADSLIRRGWFPEYERDKFATAWIGWVRWAVANLER